MARVLAVDDDGHIREILRFALEQAGHTVLEAADGRAALRVFEAEAPDAIILDVTMPEEDGLEVCRKIRATSQVPILFLSSRDDELDRILGLELGADDYVTKPFSPRELLARLKAMLRRSQRAPVEPDAGPLTHGALRLDVTQHRAHWGAAEIALTATEFTLLRVLLRHPGRAYTRAELVDRAWGPGYHVTDRTIDSHIRRIRKKLHLAGGDVIETVFGVGYRLK
ncbi:response regulator transcription factor [Myxococcota bacterium]|nr:response regulator transcription factor [Myxococcota bacterium]MBU1429034.1 response regulator transcription factor [Myxococcota bacterium]MBU1898194.1 response regulator transcription factor [Myxococcota bacterium]